ncbi:hypothetical protein AB0M45_30925 [Nocardia sp. NPDC051787]|uniref:hypothetical protein n=1 Tax=Nocardia sp. NPDC051787 TaxID=3155415 RepID=UPI00343C645D
MTDDHHLGFLQSDDGTWSVVGPDGWPVEIRSYGTVTTGDGRAITAGPLAA